MEDPRLHFKSNELSEDLADDKDFFTFFVAPVLFVTFLFLLVACFTNN